MLINDVRKGTKIRTTDGYTGTMLDNLKGMSRLIQIDDGPVKGDRGSEYVFKIKSAQNANGEWEDVQLSPKQQELARRIRAFGF